MVSCILGSGLHAQHPVTIWSRTTLNFKATPTLNMEGEVQHRRQEAFERNNPFDKNLMYSFRTWIYYKPNTDIVFSASPFAYFSHYKIIRKKEDETANTANEYRFTAAIEWQYALFQDLHLVERTAAEYRIMEGSIENTIRARQKFGLRYTVTKKLNMAMGDEILLNASGTDEQHILDHNRVFFNFGILPSATFKIDFGYIFISRLSKTSVSIKDENTLYLNFTYKL